MIKEKLGDFRPKRRFVLQAREKLAFVDMDL